MLLPDPYTVVALVVIIVMLALNILMRRRAHKVAAIWGESSSGPAGYRSSEIIIYNSRRSDGGLGIVFGLLLLALLSWWMAGIPQWTTDLTHLGTIKFDDLPFPGAQILWGFFSVLFTLRLAGYYVLSIDGLSKHGILGWNTMRWENIKQITIDFGEGIVPLGILIKDESESYHLNRSMTNVKLFYEEALRRLPPEVEGQGVREFFEEELQRSLGKVKKLTKLKV